MKNSAASTFSEPAPLTRRQSALLFVFLLVICALQCIVYGFAVTRLGLELVLGDRVRTIAVLLLTPPAGLAVLFWSFHAAGGLSARAAGVQKVLVGGLIVALLYGARYGDFAFLRYAAAAFAVVLALWLVERTAKQRAPRAARVVGRLGGALLALTLVFALFECVLVVRFLRFSAARPTGVLDIRDVLYYNQGAPGNLRPNLRAPHLLGNGGTGSVISNAAGFRTEHELTLPKPRSEYRILMLGDSFTFGYRTDQARFLARLLEDELNRQAPGGRQVRVYPGWTQDQFEFRDWLQNPEHRAAKFYEADLLLHGICLGNDISTTYLRQAPAADVSDLYQRPLPPEALDATVFQPGQNFEPGWSTRMLRTEPRLRALLTAAEPTPIYHNLPVRFGNAPRWNTQNDMGLFLRAETPDVHAAYETFERTLREIDRARGAVPVVLFLIPQRYQQSDAEWQAQARFYGLHSAAFDRDVPNRKLLAMCARLRLRCVDLLPAFRASGGGMYHLPYDMHWNDAGNALAARTLAPRVRESVREHVSP